MKTNCANRGQQAADDGDGERAADLLICSAPAATLHPVQ